MSMTRSGSCKLIIGAALVMSSFGAIAQAGSFRRNGRSRIAGLSSAMTGTTKCPDTR